MPKQKIIYSLETIYSIIRDAKREGKTIGLTHGAFDLFHYAHLDLLKKSAAECDFLIVGVDSDESVSSYKSYKRPIIGERERLKIINELNCVDAVFVKDIPLDNADHVEMYKELSVDTITIGTRYSKKFKPGLAEICTQAGASLIEIKTKQDPSTTAIINKIISIYN